MALIKDDSYEVIYNKDFTCFKIVKKYKYRDTGFANLNAAMIKRDIEKTPLPVVAESFDPRRQLRGHVWRAITFTENNSLYNHCSGSHWNATIDGGYVRAECSVCGYRP